MTKTEVLTNYTAFYRLSLAMEGLNTFTGCLGVPIEFKGTFWDYQLELILKSQPNLTIEFIKELDDAIYERSRYRLDNRIKFKTDEEWHKDNYEYVKEKLSHWIDENEEDLKHRKKLTEEEIQELKKIVDEKGKIEGIKYINKKLREGIAYAKKYLDTIFADNNNEEKNRK